MVSLQMTIRGCMDLSYKILQHARYLLHVPESSRPKPLTRASVSEFCFRNNSLVKATIFPRPFQFYHLWIGMCRLKAPRRLPWPLWWPRFWHGWSQDKAPLDVNVGKEQPIFAGWFAYFALKFPRFNTGTGGGCHWCVQRLWYSQPLKIIQVNQPSPLWENNGKHTWSLKLKVFHHWKLEKQS